MKRILHKGVFWLLGLASLVWLIVRSGSNPRRLMYPCQRIALANSLTFLSGPLSLLASSRLYHKLRGGLVLLHLVILAFLLTGGGVLSAADRLARPTVISSLPGWTSPGAVSNVFAVADVPSPVCSLDGGQLPSTPPCNEPAVAFSDRGITALLALMNANGEPFYRTTQQTAGLIGKDDIVVIKVNNQWGGEGIGQGAGRMATNTDVLKGLIWAILSHPDGFQGEVVIAENAQPTSTNDWDANPANAEDQGQSFLDVVAAFRSLGFPVSLFDWTALNGHRVEGGDVFSPGYPQGEYFHGDMQDAYILLDDPQGSAQYELSYPKFCTAGGHYISLRYGLWESGSYQSERLKLINLPVLKRHGMSGATIAWKNLIGFITADGYSRNRFGGYTEMHDYFFGYAQGPNQDYGLLGRQIALVRKPDLNLVDAIWVAFQNNTTGEAVRQDILLASRDPFALDWYASEFVLYPIVGRADVSAARGGVFRRATRVNQNSAQMLWPAGEGDYPFIDLDDTYDGELPLETEKAQMNVFVSSPSPNIKIYLPVVNTAFLPTRSSRPLRVEQTQSGGD